MEFLWAVLGPSWAVLRLSCAVFFTSSFVLGALAVPDLSYQRPFESLGVKSLLRHRSLLGALVFRDCYVAARPWGLWCRVDYITLRSWEPWSSQLVYVTTRSWEPWCSEIVTLPLALGSFGVELLKSPFALGSLVFLSLFASPLAVGSLGVQRLLRCRSLLGALVFRPFYVTARSWEPWC